MVATRVNVPSWTSRKKNLPRITARLAVHRKSIQNQALPCGVISLMPLPHICHLCASPRITCRVRAAGISPGFPHGLGHGLDNLWLQGGGCVIVHVNPPGGKKRRWGWDYRCTRSITSTGASRARAGSPQPTLVPSEKDWWSAGPGLPTRRCRVRPMLAWGAARPKAPFFPACFYNFTSFL